MSDINQVALTGRLTADPRLRETDSGTPMLQFSVAVGESRKRADGSWEEVPNYVDCTLWGARARAMERQLRRGDAVAVAGRLKFSSWEKDGQRRTHLGVTVGEVRPFMWRRQGEPPAAPEAAKPPVDPGLQALVDSSMAQPGAYYDEEVPF